MTNGERFLSRISSSRYGADPAWTAAEFSRLVSPVIGQSAAGDLNRLYSTREAEKKDKSHPLLKLGYIAAFFLGEYDDTSMPLDKEDWEEIRNTLEDVSGEIELNTLTELMGELVARGLLNNQEPG
ncbi:MAG: hypothetical protein LBT16_14415 [Treponema sp.]|jgi:hypothetical protein|nr:hypothetical protein [Treponema sp.]